MVETQIPNYAWIAEIWLIKSLWTPIDCYVFISFEVDPQCEDLTKRAKGVWTINLSLKQPYYWQDDEESNEGQHVRNPHHLVSGVER